MALQTAMKSTGYAIVSVFQKESTKLEQICFPKIIDSDIDVFAWSRQVCTILDKLLLEKADSI